MESRKVVLIKLFSGHQWRHGNREQTFEQTYGHGGLGKEEWDVWRVYHGNIHYICKIDSQ